MGRTLPRTGPAHDHCQPLVQWLGQLAITEFQKRRHSADLVFINQGITFSVYSDRRGVEKIFPFDLIPRPVAGERMAARSKRACIQRIQALNLFLYDVYHDQRILQGRRHPGRAGARVEGLSARR